MGIVSFLTVRLVEIGVVLLLILFMPSLPPKSNFTQFKVTPARSLEGKLELNERLNNVEHLYENELKGAEAFAEYNGELYTSLFNGDVVKLSNGHIVPIAKFGKPCAGFAEEALCGRPLGLQFDKNGILYVADAYMGVWKVDVQTGKKTLLISMMQEIEGKKPMIPNSLALSENGDIYWTDSSTEFKLEDGVFTLLVDGTGRVLHYNAKTKTNKVLMGGLHFANGIILSDNEEFLVISETARSKLHRYYLKGPNKGTTDIFIDGLPGLPDNLNSDGKDGFLVPLLIARDADHPIISQVLGPFPLIRKLIARIFGLSQLGMKTIDRIYPNVYTQGAVHWIGHFQSVSAFLPSRTTILHVSKNGEILDSLHSNDKSISIVSDAFIYGDQLYLGSPFNHYIGRISLANAGFTHLIRNKREAPVKQNQQTPQPVKQQTTPPTPKPTQPPSPTAAPKKAVPPTAAPIPTKSPVKQTPPKQAPPTAAPAKQAQPTATPVKQVPPTAAPVTQTQPKAAPVKRAAPTAAPVKQAAPTAAPVKQAAPTAAPVKQAAPTAAPVKQAAPTAAPVKQAQPTVVPVKQVAPKVVPVKQAPPTQAPKQTASPKPIKQTTKKSPAAAPVKEAASREPAPVREAPPRTQPVKQTQPTPKPTQPKTKETTNNL